MQDKETKEFKAQEAKRLKKNLLDRIFENKKDMLLDEFTRIEVGDSKALVDIHTSYMAIQFLEDEIQSIINSGKIANSMIK